MLIFSQTLSPVIFNSNLFHLLLYQGVRILIEMSSNKINAFPRQNNNEKQRTAWPCWGYPLSMKDVWHAYHSSSMRIWWNFTEGLRVNRKYLFSRVSIISNRGDKPSTQVIATVSHFYRTQYPSPRSCSRLKYSVKLRILWLIIMFPTIFDGHMLVVDLPNWHNPHCNICKVTLR